MLPDPLQEYLAKQPKSECGHVLRVLSWITEHDGFKKAVESVNEAVVRNISPNCHWGQTYTFDKMWISGGMIKSLLKIILGRPSCVKEQ